ncbi:hypothetical protein OG339_19875 [Streptosporangium sp. NBC_01495]|uniref:hypothetical protein n=1 Tax=Streptosporangium sp. NBC_01495 TaxID=2903899 RepID=UPI002E342EF9|nr:hypothetical protein [Streptosporangium sp. NBC_01495]
MWVLGLCGLIPYSAFGPILSTTIAKQEIWRGRRGRSSRGGRRTGRGSGGGRVALHAQVSAGGLVVGAATVVTRVACPVRMRRCPGQDQAALAGDRNVPSAFAPGAHPLMLSQPPGISVALDAVGGG